MATKLPLSKKRVRQELRALLDGGVWKSLQDVILPAMHQRGALPTDVLDCLGKMGAWHEFRDGADVYRLVSKRSGYTPGVPQPRLDLRDPRERGGAWPREQVKRIIRAISGDD